MDNRQTGRDAAVKGERQPLLVSSETYLKAGQNHVIATIPLATANDYTIYLPPVSECYDETILIEGVRASGTYVDGNVTVDSLNDGAAADGITTDTMTANQDRVVIRNIKGRYWLQDLDVTT